MADDGPGDDARLMICIVCMDDDVEGWDSTIGSLLVACDRVVVLVATEVFDEARAHLRRFPAVDVYAITLSDAADRLQSDAHTFVIAHGQLTALVDTFDVARKIVADDPRAATISFFSNGADYLSMPRRNQPDVMVPAGMGPRTLNDRLRSDRLTSRPVPIAVPAGHAVVVNADALRMIGGFLPSSPTAEYAIVDFALRAARRGLNNLLDPSTYLVATPGRRPWVSVLHDEAMRARLSRSHASFPALFDHECLATDTPLALAMSVARTTLTGLRILIDASALGPFETGTQVQLLALVEALSLRADVVEVVVGVPPGPVPTYALRVLTEPKVRTVVQRDLHFDHEVGRVDILHRPFQPDRPVPWVHWRGVADRVVISVLDLIAYENGAYFSAADEWLRYRDDVSAAVEGADGVVAISQDTAESVIRARLPVAPDRLRVIELGTDHPLGVLDAERIPSAFLERGLVGADFVFVLGATYAHKNRDLAIRSWQALRDRGYPQKLVLAGVVVPWGSTRNDEADILTGAPGGDPDIIVLPDVDPAERLWLLSHARLLLYPTSAEGFGLVPFEAAACGTPTIFVRFGPLAELIASVPVAAAAWTPAAFADAMARVIDDPALARDQTEAVASSAARLTWDDSASELVGFYRELLAHPAFGR